MKAGGLLESAPERKEFGILVVAGEEGDRMGSTWPCQPAVRTLIGKFDCRRSIAAPHAYRNNQGRMTRKIGCCRLILVEGGSNNDVHFLEQA